MQTKQSRADFPLSKSHFMQTKRSRADFQVDEEYGILCVSIQIQLL